MYNTWYTNLHVVQCHHEYVLESQGQPHLQQTFDPVINNKTSSDMLSTKTYLIFNPYFDKCLMIIIFPTSRMPSCFLKKMLPKKIILYFDIICFTSKAITAGGAIDSALLFATCVVT